MGVPLGCRRSPGQRYRYPAGRPKLRHRTVDNQDRHASSIRRCAANAAGAWFISGADDDPASQRRPRQERRQIDRDRRSVDCLVEQRDAVLDLLRGQRAAAAWSTRGRGEPNAVRNAADQSGAAGRECFVSAPSRATRCGVVPAIVPMLDEDRPANRPACTAARSRSSTSESCWRDRGRRARAGRGRSGVPVRRSPWTRCGPTTSRSRCR